MEFTSIIGNIIVLLIVGIAVFFAVRSMVKDKKAGKSVSCGCDCKNCPGGCHHK
jgi:large-conductance mechanosensitive channel